MSRVNLGWVVRSHVHVTAGEFETAIAPIQAEGGGAIRWFVCQPNAEEFACALHYGLVADAPLLHMRCALPLANTHQLPNGFTTRPFRPGEDDAAWLAINHRAFAAHPEQGGWTQEVLTTRCSEPWFDAEGFLIYEDAGQMVGFCWTQEHHRHDAHHATDAAPVGEIYVIGVDPAHHGKGLGRALTIAGFARLAKRGFHHGMLYVAGDNTAAIALYSSLGMNVDHRDDVFVGTLNAK